MAGISQNASQFLSASFTTIEVNADFTEATVSLNDGSKLLLCHKVGERWVKAIAQLDESSCLAAKVLARIAKFRLNGKHLEIQFDDASRWNADFR